MESYAHLDIDELSTLIQNLKQLHREKLTEREIQTLSNLAAEPGDFKFIPRKYSIPGVNCLPLPVKITIVSWEKREHSDWKFDNMECNEDLHSDIYEILNEQDFFDEYRTQVGMPQKWCSGDDWESPDFAHAIVEGYLYWKSIPFPEYDPEDPNHIPEYDPEFPLTFQAIDPNHIQGCEWTVYPDYVKAEDSVRISKEEWPTSLICVLHDLY